MYTEFYANNDGKLGHSIEISDTSKQHILHSYSHSEASVPNTPSTGNSKFTTQKTGPRDSQAVNVTYFSLLKCGHFEESPHYGWNGDDLRLTSYDLRLTKTSRRRRRHVPHRDRSPAAVTKRNERERTRVSGVNEAFTELHDHLPGVLRRQRLPKIKILHAATFYIDYLAGLLRSDIRAGRSNGYETFADICDVTPPRQHLTPKQLFPLDATTATTSRTRDANPIDWLGRGELGLNSCEYIKRITKNWNGLSPTCFNFHLTKREWTIQYGRNLSRPNIC